MGKTIEISDELYESIKDQSTVELPNPRYRAGPTS